MIDDFSFLLLFYLIVKKKTIQQNKSLDPKYSPWNLYALLYFNDACVEEGKIGVSFDCV